MQLLNKLCIFQMVEFQIGENSKYLFFILLIS